MGGQLNESLSFVERAPFARYARVLLLAVVGVLLLTMTWNDAGASTSVLHHHLFLMGSALVMAVTAATLALAPWWDKVKAYLLISHLVIMGLYIGLAVATTDWSHWSLHRWWQGWWAFPFLAGQIQQVQKLLRVNA